jgi:Holliday junction DNA helicase RuvA
VTELKDRMPSLARFGAPVSGIPIPDAAQPGTAAAADAVSALTNLGYAHAQASAAISAASLKAGDKVGTAELIRLGLKELAQ